MNLLLRFRRAPWVEHLLVFGFFTALTVGMTWPLALLLDRGIDAFGDVVLQMTTMTWAAHALTTDPLHIFDAPFFYPYYHSLAYSDHLIGQTLLTLPVFVAGGSPALALNLYKLWSFAATGYATYLLVRDSTGSRAGGLVAGVAFAFVGLRFMQLTHLHLLATEWFPFTLWALRRGLARNSGRWLAGAAVFFALMALCSVYYSYFLALAVGGYLILDFGFWIADWRRYRRVDQSLSATDNEPIIQNPKSKIQNFKWLTVIGAVLAVVLLPFYWPYLQVNQELGLARSIYEVQNWSAVWGYYVSVLPSNWFWGQHGWLPTSILGERQLFPGGIVVGLAALGLILGSGRWRAAPTPAPADPAPDAPRRAERWYWVALGLAALVLTFGLSYRLPNGWDIPLPYALLYDWVPGFQALRVPVRFAVLLDLALAVLAGYAIADCSRWIADWQRRRAERAAAVAGPARQNSYALRITHYALPALLIGGILLESAQVLEMDNNQDVRPAQIEPYSRLATLGRGPVIEFPFRGDSGDIWDAYWGTYHWRPLVNGWSGFVPPGTVYLSRALAAFPDPATVALLQGLEVEHVVVHLWQFPPDQQAGLRDRLAATPALTLAHQAGEDYVYTLAADPWLRGLAATESAPGPVWFSAGVGAAHPEMEVLAYFARYRLGWPGVHGDVPLGYRPLPPLPWGVPADYMIQPPGEPPPFGYRPEGENALAAVYRRDPALVARYDWLAPNAPACCGVTVAEGAQHIRLLLGTTVTTTFGVPTMVDSGGVSLDVPPGASSYVVPGLVLPREYALGAQESDAARLLATEAWSAPPGPAGLTPLTDTLLLDVTTYPPANGAGGVATQVDLVPRGPEGAQYTLTLDVYQKPWGTHPDGHYGTFSVPVPVGADGRTYDLRLRPAEKAATALLNGGPFEVFPWIGPPTEGDFAASLVLSLGERLIAKVPVYDFTLRDGRLTAVQVHPARTLLTPFGGK